MVDLQSTALATWLRSPAARFIDRTGPTVESVSRDRCSLVGSLTEPTAHHALAKGMLNKTSGSVKPTKAIMTIATFAKVGEKSSAAAEFA